MWHCPLLVSGSGDIEQFRPPLQFQRNVINVEIVFSEASFLLSISTLYNFNGRAQRAREKIRYNFNRFAISTFSIFAKCDNFNVVTISTFWKPWFHSNFNGLTISTFYISLEYNNFDVIQFQRARAARRTKNTLQFQQTYNFYFLSSGKCDNFNGLAISTFVVFWEYDNFNIKHHPSPKFISAAAIGAFCE